MLLSKHSYSEALMFIQRFLVSLLSWNIEMLWLQISHLDLITSLSALKVKLV